MDEGYSDTWPHPADIGGARESSGRAPKRRRTNANGGPTGERGIMRDGNRTGLPRFIGSGSGINLVMTVYNVLARSHTDQGRNHHDAAGVVPGEEDQLTGPSPSDPLTPGGLPITPFWHPDEIAGSMADASFDNLLQWTESSFRYWHPIFPLLHGPTFLGVLEQVSQDGIEALHPADAIVVRSILSISLADSRQIGGRHHSFPPSLVFLNQKDVGASLIFILSNPVSMKNIQAALCVELFLISMLNFNMASRVGGIIVRMSFNLGLHRCPARFPNFGPHDVSMRKRLWWSVYCLDRVVCQTLGLPLGIRDDDIDVCLPSEELHKLRRDSQNNSTSLQGQCHESEQLRLLTVMSKHAKLRGMILELRNKSIRFRYEDPERALQVQAELKKWVNEVYDLTNTHLLSRNSPSENERGGGTDTADDCMHSSHRILLAILQHELTLSFHRPLLSSDLGTASSQAAFQDCINASKAIIDTVASTSQNSRQEEPNLKHGHLLWPSLTWSVWMSCFVLTYAAIEGVITAVSAMRQVFSSAPDSSTDLVLMRLIRHRYANRALRVLKLLSLRKTSWPEKCILAVEQLIAFLDDRERNEGQLPSIGRRSQRTSSLQSRNLTDTSETPAAHSHDHATSQTPNYNKPREYGRSFRPRNTSVNISGSVDHQSQSVPPSSSTNFPAMTGPQEFSMAGFPGFTSNTAFEYAGTQGLIGADPLSALDFANFAQGPTVPSMPDFSFGFNGFN